MKKISAVLFLAIAISAHAQDGPKIWGGTDCGRWIKYGSAIDKTWLMGYLRVRLLAV